MNNAAAFQFVQDLAKELSHGNVDLPGFPRVFAQVCRALDDPTNTNERTAKIVGAEPTLAARILALSNSASFTVSGKPISELRSAVTRLGSNSIRAATSSFAVAQVKRQSSVIPVYSRLEELWQRSTHLAALCSVIGRVTKVNPDEALLTGLLHGVGSLYLLVHAASYPALLSEDGTLVELMLDWNAQITKSILENWSFPDNIVEAAGEQDDQERKHSGAADLADVLICAKTLVDCGMDRGQVEERYHHVPAFAKLGLTMDQYTTVIEQAQLQIAAVREALRA
jgi:HD-like signal output (HDOD) protein